MLAVLLFTLTLLLAKPGEMFYWPMGAAAYLLCWAGLAAATVLHRTNTGQHWIALTLSLSIAALSAEIGAITVLFYAILVGVVFLRRRLVYRLRPLILPVLGAAVVCLVVLNGRTQSDEWSRQVAWPAIGQASFFTALPTFAREAAGVGGIPLLAGLVVAKLLLLMCLAHDGQQAARSSVPLPYSLGRRTPAGRVLVLYAYHKFGGLCCERHATMRQGMLILALVAVSGLCRNAPLLQRQIVLAALLVVLLGMRVVPLYGDWRLLSDVLAARQSSWESASDHSDTMMLFVAPPAKSSTGTRFLPAASQLRSFPGECCRHPWWAAGIINRFGKRSARPRPRTTSMPCSSTRRASWRGSAFRARRSAGSSRSPEHACSATTTWATCRREGATRHGGVAGQRDSSQRCEGR